MGEGADTSGYVVPPRLWSWLGKRTTVLALVWLAAFGVADYLVNNAWTWFGNKSDVPEPNRRRDGNSGHAQVDFGGQWLMGRMIVEGHARELYHRQRQRQVLWAHYPIQSEPLANELEWHLPSSARTLARPRDDLGHDADMLMGWFMGKDPPEWRIVGSAAAAPLAQGPFTPPAAGIALHLAAANALTPEVVETVTTPSIGGPLYPPVHAFFYAPLATLEPQPAYHLFQVLAAVMVFVAGLGVAVLTRGKIPWPVATLLLLVYPGTRAGLDLAQNPTVTLSIAVWGWALASRGYNTAGGVVWGLFAFKPVWALAFCIVPLLTRRWRFCFAMVATGVGLCAATLPFVGVQTWFDWLEIGKKAAALYNVNQNWITLSRDLQGIPRRLLHDFNLPESERDTALARTLAWTLWGAVFVATVGLYLRYADYRRATGTGAAFLFFGAWLTCYRFMYYDVLVSALGYAVLLAEPARFLRTRIISLSEPVCPSASGAVLPAAATPGFFRSNMLGYVNSFPLTILALMLVFELSWKGMAFEATFGVGYYGKVTTGADGATSASVPRVIVDTTNSYPWDTFMILAVWMWCGWRLIRGEERAKEAVEERPPDRAAA